MGHHTYWQKNQHIESRYLLSNAKGLTILSDQGRVWLAHVTTRKSRNILNKIDVTTGSKVMTKNMFYIDFDYMYIRDTQSCR
jgi:hypothetical protein